MCLHPYWYLDLTVDHRVWRTNSLIINVTWSDIMFSSLKYGVRISLAFQSNFYLITLPTALFNMHRGFFAKALEDHPNDPLSSPYQYSVLATYNAACTYIGVVELLNSQYPEISMRICTLFDQMFSCAVRIYSLPNTSALLTTTSSLCSAQLHA
jgi:hypothetical protein